MRDPYLNIAKLFCTKYPFQPTQPVLIRIYIEPASPHRINYLIQHILIHSNTFHIKIHPIKYIPTYPTSRPKILGVKLHFKLNKVRSSAIPIPRLAATTHYGDGGRSRRRLHQQPTQLSPRQHHLISPCSSRWRDLWPLAPLNLGLEAQT